MSFGVKGARVSVSQRGTFVTVGAGGISYRKRISGPSDKRNQFHAPGPLPLTPEPSDNSNYLHTITSGNVENITDVDSQKFIEELEGKSKKILLWKYLGVIPSVIVVLFTLNFLMELFTPPSRKEYWFQVTSPGANIRMSPSKNSEIVGHVTQYETLRLTGHDSTRWIGVISAHDTVVSGFIHETMGKRFDKTVTWASETRVQREPRWITLLIVEVAGAIAWCIYLFRIDRERKSMEINYTFDSSIQSLHDQFISFFGEFSTCNRIWQNLHLRGVENSKYHAGASQLVSRIAIRGVAGSRMPASFFKTNVAIPYIRLKNTELYFFPERLIIKRGSAFGAVFYKNMIIAKSHSRFIEEQGVTGDATVVDYAWKYTNKSGGPDRRFSNNYQIPICLYSEYEFMSDSGLHEVIVTSRTGGMDSFSSFVKTLGDYQRKFS